MRGRWPTVAVVVCCLLGMASGLGWAQDDGEDELGNWLIWNGTVRFSDRWSLFTEAQLRLWELTSMILRACRVPDYSSETKPIHVSATYLR